MSSASITSTESQYVRYGFKIAPAVGLCMAELVLNGKASTVDISDFDPERFARGKPIVAKHEYGDD